MAKKHKTGSAEKAVSLSEEQAREWLFDKIKSGEFRSSVRGLVKSWGWGTTKISLFLRKLEDEGVLKRTLVSGGKTLFELVDNLDEFPKKLKAPTHSNFTNSVIGIDIEQVYHGNLQISEQSLQKLEAQYKDVMDGCVTELSVSELEMIESILERQMPKVLPSPPEPKNAKRAKTLANSFNEVLFNFQKSFGKLVHANKAASRVGR